MADSSFSFSLEQGIQAAKEGQLQRARVLLAQAVQQEPGNDLAWLWLSAVVEDDWEKLYCLQRAKRANPQNKAALRGLEALSARLGGQELPEGRPQAAVTEKEGAARQPEARLDTAAMDMEQAVEVQTPLALPHRDIAPAKHAVSRSVSWATLGTFVAQRLLFGLLILVAISYLSYLGLDMAEGTAFPQAAPQAGFKMISYLGRLLHGDLGSSIAGSTTYAPVLVAQVIPGLLAKSLGLLAVSLLFATVVGVSLGMWAARRRHSGWALMTVLASITGVSVPSFFAALLLQLAVIQWTRTFGRMLLPVGGFGWDERIILPALVLSARPIAQIARMTFVSMGQVLDRDFVRTAYGKGLSPRMVVSRHVIRNVAIPVLTTVGVSLRYSLSSLPVVEFFFSWTGMGFTLLKAIARRDDSMTVALVLCLGMLFILVNLFLETFYRLIDPRLRAQVTRAEQQERETLAQILHSVFVGLWDWLVHLPLWRWFARAKPTLSPFRDVLASRGIKVDLDSELYKEERERAWLRGTIRNVPFVVGSLLVGGLVLLVLFGPALTPHSPYTKRGLEYSDGKLTVPPFAPNEEYPWGTDPLGRDILSLVMAGAQQTLLLVTLVVSARVVLGFVLGALAGWLSGSWVDRALLALAEVVAAFPTLLLSMTLILALGINRGLEPFVVALSLVGWGEIMQYVRGEAMSIRVKPFIESAVALGLRTPRVIWSHVLPNLLPALISIAALEMGAVLMLLGELGFVGIFIGGGAFAELQIDAPPYHYSDVPEWGALLSDIRLYARAYPWMALYPAIAFFVAILGFNLFGEGIRRMIETVGIGITRLFNRYTVGIALVVVVGIGWAQANTGAIAYYRHYAATFSGQQALSYVQALSEPGMQGRAVGSAGNEAAARYIARMFQSVGLQPGGQSLTYFQERARSFESLDAIPQLAIVGQQEPLVYRQDYAEYPSAYRNLGQFEGRVRVVACRELSLVQTRFAGSFYRAFEDLDLRGDVIMLLSERDMAYVRDLGLDGVLVVAEDPADVQRRYTLSSKSPIWNRFGTGRTEGQDTPVMWISEATADRILRDTGKTIADLRREVEVLEQDQVLQLPTEVRVSMRMEGTVQDKVTVRNVIGHLPGTSDSRYGGLNSKAIVVLAKYDAPPLSPDGMVYPGANDNATGVALLAEIARTMRDSGYQPYRTFLFIAYSSEGQEGGELVNPSDVRKFLQAQPGFSANLDVEAIVHLRGLGSGTGDELVLAAQGSRRLLKLFERSARQMGVPAALAKETVDLSIVFEDKSHTERGQEAPEMIASWEGWEATSRLPTDTAETVSADRLEQAGRALSLALMIIGREQNY